MTTKSTSNKTRTLPDQMRAEDILTGLSDRQGDVLKVCPPLVFEVKIQSIMTNEDLS